LILFINSDASAILPHDRRVYGAAGPHQQDIDKAKQQAKPKL